MGVVASRLNLRLFIDGLEVPVIGARCTYAEGAPATAQIQLIPTDQAYDILPRSLITLFYYDGSDQQNPKHYGPYDLRRWKLLFMGELAGINYTKQGSQRMVTLDAMCLTSYLDSVKQHFLNFQNGGVELFENAFLGVKADRLKFYDVTTKDVHSNIFVWLTQSNYKDPKTGKSYASIYLGVQRILRELFFASNFFYARAFNRLRLGDQIVGLPQDRTAAQLIKIDFFDKFIKNQIGGAGGFVTLRQVIDILLGTAFHTYITVPCPRFDPKGEALGSPLKAQSLPDQKILSQIIKRNAWPKASLNHIIIKPDTWFLAPPLCNIIFPHQYNSIAYQRNYYQEPTRLFLRSSLIFTGQDKWLTERFYSPDFEVFNQLLYKQGGYLERLASVILPHEEYVGLNPVETWQSDLGAYVQKGARREYLARVADYLFWKYRFGTRTVNVSMPFNPNLVPGYPALVMDRTGVPGLVSRHFMGNVQALVHSIDQNGGWTHITMVGARLHDETIDFDAKNRSLEVITSRGTDGFMDDRYDLENIGKDVYKPIFGCGSLIDLLKDGKEISDPLVQRSLAAVSKINNPVIKAVAVAQALYQVAISSGADIQSFTDALTGRPKASLVEVLGLPMLSDNVSEDEAAALQVLKQELESSGGGVEGFMSVAVDTAAADHKNDKYTTTVVTTRVQNVETQKKTVQEQFGADGQTHVVTVTEPAVTTRQVTSVAKKTQASYQLKQHLQERQDKVQLYLNSLKFRGLRG